MFYPDYWLPNIMILIDVFTKNIIYEGKTTINNIFVNLSLNWFNIKFFSEEKMYSTEIAQNLFHNLKNYICGFIYLLECKIFQVLLEVGFIDIYIDLEIHCNWYISKIQSVTLRYWEGSLDNNQCCFHRSLGILCFFSAYATNLRFRTQS